MLDMLTDPTYGLMTLIVLAFAGLLVYIAWRALNGDFRTWAVLPPIPFQISKHNTWPFMLLMSGVAVLTAVPTIYFEYARMEAARQLTWNLFFIPLAFVILSFLWWPTALAPAWYRDWARRVRADPAASPWTTAEIEQVRNAPASRRRTRALRDIERVAGTHHVEGLLPETWLERTARTSTARSQEIDEAAGVTEDMDAIQRALRIKEHRKQEKAARRAAGHDRS